MDEKTSWAAAELPDLNVPHQGFDWPSDGPGLFDTSHAETATLYWAQGQPTRLFLAEFPNSESDEVYRQIPMGYTTLATMEKVAVVADGHELRVWPHSDRATNPGDFQRYQLIVPPTTGGHLKLGASWPFRYALADAVALSARTHGPVVVCRVLEHRDWH